MNRGSVGCSTESACGVGLANCQDARFMCECVNGVNYICGEDQAVNTNFIDSNIEGKRLGQDILWNENHSINKRNKNRIRRSLLRRIYAVNLKEGLSEVKRKQKLKVLTQALALYPKRQKERQLNEGGQPLVHRKQKVTKSFVNRKKSGGGFMGIRYPRSNSNTKVCTKSKNKDRRFKYGTGRGQRRSRDLRQSHSREIRRIRDLERLLFQDQEIDPSLISNILTVPDFKQDSTKIFTHLKFVFEPL